MHISKGYTYDEDLFSDFFKDVFGFRPRNHIFYHSDPDEKQRIWDRLMEDSKLHFEMEEKAQKEAIEEFEKHIDQVIEWGAGTRENAISWIIDSYCDPFLDTDYVLYDLNLPFSYKEEIKNGFKNRKTF